VESARLRSSRIGWELIEDLAVIATFVVRRLRLLGAEKGAIPVLRRVAEEVPELRLEQ